MPIDGSNNFKGGGPMGSRPPGGSTDGKPHKPGDKGDNTSPNTPQGRVATKGLMATKPVTANPVLATPPTQSNTKTTKAILPWQNLLGGTKIWKSETEAAPKDPSLGVEEQGKDVLKTAVFRDGKPPEIQQSTRNLAQGQDQPHSVNQRIQQGDRPGFFSFLGNFFGGGEFEDERKRMLEQLRTRGFLGFAGLVWYDPEKKRPSSIWASLIVNGIIVAAILLLLYWA